MESELDRLRRANAELQAWVRDLLEENRHLRRRAADRPEPDPSRTAAKAQASPA
jgi:hypothetical protein